VENNVYNEADTFRVEFVASRLPSETSPSWFVTQANIKVEIRADLPSEDSAMLASQYARLLQGYVDTVELDPVAGTLTISGRDNTGVLIDTPSTASYKNQTASDVVKAIAGAHNFTPVVVATTTTVGSYYQHDKAHQHDRGSEWDLLCWLAEREGFVVYMQADELHFEPRKKQPGQPYVIQWQGPDATRAWPQANVMDLRFSRDLTMMGGVSVTVESAHSADGKPYSVTWPEGAAPAGNGLPARHYFSRVANYRPDECRRLAQALYGQYAQHEMRLEATLPADGVLTTSLQVKVVGSGTAFDQTYWPVSVRRTMSMDQGYVMTLTAKNASPGLEAQQ
jgi:phage protein D